MGHSHFIISQLCSPHDVPCSWLSSMHLFCNVVTAAQETLVCAVNEMGPQEKLSAIM